MTAALHRNGRDDDENDPFLDGLRLTRVYAEASVAERADLERFLRDLRAGRIIIRSATAKGPS